MKSTNAGMFTIPPFRASSCQRRMAGCINVPDKTGRSSRPAVGYEACNPSPSGHHPMQMRRDREHDDHLANTSRTFPARFGQEKKKKKALFPTRNNGLCSRQGDLRVIPAGDPVTGVVALAAPDGHPRTVAGDRKSISSGCAIVTGLCCIWTL